MEFSDPVSIYKAENNQDARMAQLFLDSHGIEAVAHEDNSVTGNWMLGALPSIHNSEVWVDRINGAQAKALIEEYVTTRHDRRLAEKAGADEILETVCESCGKTSTFPGGLKGTVQECPHCRSYVDLSDDEAWDVGEAIEEQ